MNEKNLWLIIGIPLCLILFVIFLINGSSVSNPIKSTPKLKTEWFKPELPRENLLNNATIVGNCWVCHAMWASIPQISHFPAQFVHPEVKLNHGKNNRCFNCHLESDRNHYVDNDGVSKIMYFNVELLCARCHGVVYNRWKKGMHGSLRGKWFVKGRFDVKNFKCTFCHDPHSPKYKYKKFDPSPVWDEKFIRLELIDKLKNSPYSMAFPDSNHSKGVQ
jgi:5-methylcytosine-specific restriction endonuclease McrA